MFETNTEKIFEDIVSDVSKEEVVIEKQESKKQLDNMIVFGTAYQFNSDILAREYIEYSINVFLRYFSVLPWIEYSTDENRIPLTLDKVIYGNRGIAFSFKRYAPYEIFSFYKMCSDIVQKYRMRVKGIVVSTLHLEIEDDCHFDGFRRFLDHNRNIFGELKDYATNHTTYNVDLVCGIYERRIQECRLDKSFKSYFDKKVFKNNPKVELRKLRNVGLYELLCHSRGITSSDDFGWINDHRFINAYISDVTMENLQRNTISSLRKPPMENEWVRSFSCCNIISSNVYKNKDGNLVFSAMCIKPTNSLAIRRIMFAMEIYCSHKKCPGDIIYKSFEKLLDRACAEKIQEEWNKKEYVFKDYNVLIDTKCQRKKKSC